MIYGTSREYALKLAVIISDYVLGFLIMLWGILEDAGFYLEMKGRSFIHWMKRYGIPMMRRKVPALKRALIKAWRFRAEIIAEGNAE